MSENMICPACKKFQPKAEECAECGVIIAKTQPSSPVSAEAKPDSSSGSSKGSPFPVIGIAVVFAAIVVGYLMMPDETQEEPKLTEPTALQNATSGKLKLANSMIQRASTQEKMRALITKLNIQILEYGTSEPPTNEQGLAKLVQDGLLMKEEITDAWGRDFVYELKMGPDQGVLGQTFEIRFHSAGPDGINGTGDDIGM